MADAPPTILVSPTRRESRAVLRALAGARAETGHGTPAWRADGLLVLEAGPGTIAACLPRLEALCPRSVWLFGWCGGLRPDLRTGDRVLSVETLPMRGGEFGDPIRHPPPDGTVRAIRAALEADEWGLVEGQVLSSPVMLRSRAEKRWAAATGAAAVEMEAGPLAVWAGERSIPFIHLRVVLDPVDSAVPTGTLELDAHGRASVPALLRAAAARPAEWMPWLRLLRQARVAERSMAAAMTGLAGAGGPLDPGHGRGPSASVDRVAGDGEVNGDRGSGSTTAPRP